MTITLQKLKKQLEQIKKQGFIKTHRVHDNGIGKTLEDLLGIKENNFRLPDVGDVEVKAKRIGGAAYQVPTEVRGPRRVSLAIRWILEAARKRPTSEYKKFSEKLGAELMDVNKNTGEAVRKRDVAHKMAEANRAFAHFRF